MRVETYPFTTELALNAAVGIGLLEKRQGVFSVTAEGLKLLADENLSGRVVHLEQTFHRLSWLSTLAKKGVWPAGELGLSPERLWSHYAFLDHVRTTEYPRQMVEALRLDGDILDIGAGNPAYAIAFARPAVQGSGRTAITILDFPEVVAVERTRM